MISRTSMLSTCILEVRWRFGEWYVMAYPHWVFFLVSLDDGYGPKSSSSDVSDYSLDGECGWNVIKARLFMHFLQIPSLYRAMPISIRDVVIPPNEVPSTVKAIQIGIYVNLIPAAIIVYDTRASLLQIMWFSSLTSCQSVRLTKRYAIKYPLYDSDDSARLTGQVLLGK